jgi:molecular chaperone IbpA
MWIIKLQTQDILPTTFSKMAIILQLKSHLQAYILTISHVPSEEEPSETLQWIHKGIAQRKFTRHFTLADDVVVKGASMVNGMLYIDLERIVPEEKKPRKIAIAQNK